MLEGNLSYILEHAYSKEENTEEGIVRGLVAIAERMDVLINIIEQIQVQGLNVNARREGKET